MRNIFKKLIGALGGALFLVAALAASLVPATALTIPPTYAPRVFNTQQTHYLRFLFNFNSCVIASGATTCSVKVGALPYNAFLTTIHKQILTTFNPTTSATVSLNVTGAGAGVMAAFNVFTGQATTAATDTGFTGAGEAVTGNGATQTGADGGFDLYALYTVGAAGSQGTQGAVVFIVEYIAPNDGACTEAPMNTTPGGC
jgi:hypothetical protein